MSFKSYLKDKLSLIVLELFSYIIIFIMLLLLKLSSSLIVMVTIVYFLPIIIFIMMDYLKRSLFYQEVIKKLTNLDQKYLISELVVNPDFSEAQILSNILYSIDKNYLEHISALKRLNIDFKDYIELWCHEIKTPIATTKLIIANNKSKVTESILEEINKTEKLIEQVLYYARMDTVTNDYFVSKINLATIIKNVIKNNQSEILNNKIKIILNIKDVFIYSDSKWLEFIINQILSNAIKYHQAKPYIKFLVTMNKNSTVLTIEDNGIGIKEEEIGRVFNKGFTGSNGRYNHTSTGFGLYLAHELCQKLGHDIKITSQENKYTKVFIIFPNNSLTKGIVTDL
jgi:signal transduction histidine kinase